jgi:hypothetical protein
VNETNLTKPFPANTAHTQRHGDTRKHQGHRGEGKDARQHLQRHEKSEGCEKSGERVAPPMLHSTREFRDLRVVNVISCLKMRWKCVKAICGVAETHKTIHLREKSHCRDEGRHPECAEEGNERGAAKSAPLRNAELSKSKPNRASQQIQMTCFAESGPPEQSPVTPRRNRRQSSLRNAGWGRATPNAAMPNTFPIHFQYVLHTYWTTKIPNTCIGCIGCIVQL